MVSGQAQRVVEQNSRLIELLRLDVRIYLMFALVLIVMIGLVLLLFTSAGARHLRRQRIGSRGHHPDPDDWARQPLVGPLEERSARETKAKGPPETSPGDSAEPGGSG